LNEEKRRLEDERKRNESLNGEWKIRIKEYELRLE
jgi:hypothetical protein